MITRDAQYVPGSATPIFLANVATGTYDNGVHTYANNGYPTLIQVR